MLKEAWDRALFGLPMGDRTRMAYWADIRHPEAPAGIRARTFGRNAGPDSLLPMDLPDGDAARYAERLATELGLDRERKRRGVAAKVLPIPEPARRAVTRWLTRLLIQDTAAYFFDPDERSEMQRRLRSLLIPGGGPYVVVAHSQGSIIAYDVLSKLVAADRIEIPLLVTIGSPLGIQEVQDQVAKPLRVPTVVAAWRNFADPLDPVALDKRLAGEFKGNLEDTRVQEPGRPAHPRLRPPLRRGLPADEAVRGAVAGEVGPRFASRLASFVVARDVGRGDGGRRHPARGADRAPHAGRPAPRQVRERVMKALKELVPKSQHDDAVIDPLRHYVAAELTTSEIDRLVLRESAISVLNLWKNSLKRALIERSASAIHVAPARATYRATGAGVAWAVLDTGINPRHPHFRTFGTVAGHFDCTRPGHAPIPQGASTATGTARTSRASSRARRPPRSRDEPFHAAWRRDAKLYALQGARRRGRRRGRLDHQGARPHRRAERAARALVIHGVNLSLGGPFDPDVFGCGHSPLCDELRRLWRQGVLVCVAAGNEGYVVTADDEEPSGDPGQPRPLDRRPRQPGGGDRGRLGAQRQAAHLRRLVLLLARPDRGRAREAGRGGAGREDRLACNVDFATRGEDPYVEMSGTSMACPHVSGLLAAFLSARPEFIGQPGPREGDPAGAPASTSAATATCRARGCRA